ncbi:biotin/lipoyl-containing protein [Thermodesulfobacteriota bacterium]
MIYKIAIGDKKFAVEIGEIIGGIAAVNIDGEEYDVAIENYEEIAASLAPPQPVMASPTPQAAPRVTRTTPTPTAPAPAAPATAPAAAHTEGDIVAPIPGRILDVKVKEGDQVQAGQTVATMEAMKMENNIVCNVDGTVQGVLVQKDSEVAMGDVIMKIG